MHIDDMISFWARTKPHHPAIIQPDTIITYKGLADAIDAVSQRLGQIKLDPREPVAVAIQNPAKQLAVCFALLRSGYQTAPVYHGLMPHLFAAGIRSVIYEGEGLILSGGRNIRFDASWLPSGTAGRAPSTSTTIKPPRRGSTPEMIFFTSGTTGLPKKVIQTEDALIERMNLAPQMGLPNYTRALILPGLATNFGFNHACAVLREGKTACFSLPDEARLVLISTYGVEHLVASPQQVLALAAMREASPGYQIEPLNTIWIAGAFTSTEAIKRVQTSLCRNIIMGYASTEGALVAFATHEMIANIPDAVGFVGPWVNLEIVDDAGHQVAAGAEGRIRYRTPFFVKNHLANNPDSKADPRDLWYYPGDLGYVTENGVLCVRGRGDDVINCGGQKFSAASLDEIVLTCSGVKDAGVCGFKGDTDLEEVWIGVVPTAAFALAEFQRQLEQHPRFSDLLRSVGAEVVLVDSIPRSLLGKIQRRELRDKLKSAERGAPTTG